MGAVLPTNWFRNSSVWHFARKEASISEALSPTLTAAIAPFSSTVTVTGNLPVRPSPSAVYTLSSAAGSAVASGAATGAASSAAFTAATIPLLLTVAPVTTSISSSAMGAVLPMNCPRKALSFWHLARKGASISESVSFTRMPLIAPFSSTDTSTVNLPDRPLPSPVSVSAPSGIDTSIDSAAALAACCAA